MKLRSKWRDYDWADESPHPDKGFCQQSRPESGRPETEEIDAIQNTYPHDNSDNSDVSPPNVANVTNVRGVGNEKRAEIAERAAIVAEGAGVPYDWAEGFARMQAMERPAVFTASQWEAVIASVGGFLDAWAARAAEMGWTAREVFGAHPGAPMADHSRRGLALYLRPGQRIAAITAKTATFETAGGKRTTFYRNQVSEGGKIVWEMKANPPG